MIGQDLCHPRKREGLPSPEQLVHNRNTCEPEYPDWLHFIPISFLFQLRSIHHPFPSPGCTAVTTLRLGPRERKSEDAAAPIWLTEAARGPKRRKWIDALFKRIQQPRSYHQGAAASLLLPPPLTKSQWATNSVHCVWGGGSVEWCTDHDCTILSRKQWWLRLAWWLCKYGEDSRDTVEMQNQQDLVINYSQEKGGVMAFSHQHPPPSWQS